MTRTRLLKVVTVLLLGCSGAGSSGPTTTAAEPVPNSPVAPTEIAAAPPTEAFLVLKAYPTDAAAQKTVDLLKKMGLSHGNYPKVAPAGTAGLDGGPYVVYAAPARKDVADAFAAGTYEVRAVKGWTDIETIGALIPAQNPWNTARRQVLVVPKTASGCDASKPIATANPADIVAVPDGVDVCLLAHVRAGGQPDCLVLTAYRAPVTRLDEARFWCQDDAARTGKAPSIPWRAVVQVAPDAGTESDPEWNANHEWVLSALAPLGVAARTETKSTKIVLRPDLTVDLDVVAPGHSDDGFLFVTDGKPPVWLGADDSDHEGVAAAVKDVYGLDLPP